MSQDMRRKGLIVGVAAAGLLVGATPFFGAVAGMVATAALDLGAGVRFVAKDFLAVNVAIINTSYADQPLGTTKSSTQNLMTLNAGIPLFFPFSSTGREAE